MFGLRLAWVTSRKLSRLLPGGTLALFRRKADVTRGDIVLVEHPEHGRIVRRVHTVNRYGRLSLEPLDPSRKRLRLGLIEPEWVRGALVFRLL